MPENPGAPARAVSPRRGATRIIGCMMPFAGPTAQRSGKGDGMRRVVSWFAWFGRGSLLLRFSLLSLLVLALIAVGLAAALQHELEQDALRQQADELAVVVQGVLGRHLTAQSLATAAQPRHRAWWASLGQQLLWADPHLLRIKVWDTQGRVVYSN